MTEFSLVMSDVASICFRDQNQIPLDMNNCATSWFNVCATELTAYNNYNNIITVDIDITKLGNSIIITINILFVPQYKKKQKS